MATRQLVLRDQADGSTELDAVDRNPGDQPWDFEDDSPGTHVPRLGTRDLLRLALELQALGWTITDVSLRDSRLNSLEPALDDELRDRAVESLRKRDFSDSSFLTSLGIEFVVVEIAVRRANSPWRLLVNRRAEVTPLPQGQSLDYLDDLREVWASGAVG